MGSTCAEPAPIEIALGRAVRARGAGADPRALTALLKALRVRHDLMISPSGNMQILVAPKPLDFRNYAQRADAEWTRVDRWATRE